MFRGSLLFLSLCILAGQARAWSDAPKGFEDVQILDRVMRGEIVTTDVISTKTELKTVVRAYLNRVSSESYAALAVNHPRYVELFPEVKDARTTKVCADKTEYDYWLDMEVKLGPFTQHVYPEGHHVIRRAAGVHDETLVLNTITNYQEYLQTAVQSTRLIPYQSGILVEDTVHVVLKNSGATASMAKAKLKEFFARYVAAFRKALQGDY